MSKIDITTNIYDDQDNNIQKVNNLKSDTVKFNTSHTETPTETGAMYWNNEDKTIDLILPNGVVSQITGESYIGAINQTGSDRLSGVPVMFSGSVGASGKLTMQLALSDGSLSPEWIMGIITETIIDGNSGKVTWFGKTKGFDTTGSTAILTAGYFNIGTSYTIVTVGTTDFTNIGASDNNIGTVFIATGIGTGTGTASEVWVDGDILYVSPFIAGQLTKVKPQAPYYIITICAIIKAHSNGIVMVRPSWNPKFTELSDVNSTPLTADGQIPVWDNIRQIFDFTYNPFEINTISKNATGFPNSTDSIISYDEITRTISISPSVTSFDYYLLGQKHTITDTLSKTHADITQGYFFYIDKTNTLQLTTTPWDILDNNVPISYIYYNASLKKAYIFEERHRSWRNLAAHKEFHENIGTYFGNGLGASDYTLNPASPVNSHNQPAIATGLINDEELPSIITALASGGQYNVFYREGATGEWLWTTNTLPFTSGTYIQYNEFTGTTWQLSDMSNKKYVNIYSLAVPELDGTKQLVWIIGQNKHKSLNKAINSYFKDEISVGNFPFQEACLIHKFTFRSSSSYGNTGKCRIENYEDLRGSTIFMTISSKSVEHDSLGGVKLVADAVDYGHINDQSQTIYGEKTFNSAIALKEITTPSATTGVGKVYTKSDDKLYFQDGSGSEASINTSLSEVIKMAGITTTVRDALPAVVGDIIFNTTTNRHQGYNGTIWNDLY